MSWRVWRPAIWLAMLGIAVGVLVNPYLGVLIVGGALGVALRIGRRRTASRMSPTTTAARRRTVSRMSPTTTAAAPSPTLRRHHDEHS